MESLDWELPAGWIGQHVNLSPYINFARHCDFDNPNMRRFAREMENSCISFRRKALRSLEFSNCNPWFFHVRHSVPSAPLSFLFP